MTDRRTDRQKKQLIGAQATDLPKKFASWKQNNISHICVGVRDWMWVSCFCMNRTLLKNTILITIVVSEYQVALYYNVLGISDREMFFLIFFTP